MNYLAEMLKTNDVASLIKSKPVRREKLIFLEEDDNLRTALIAFSAHGISSIPLKGHEKEFLGIIKISNLVKFILSHDAEVDVSILLDFKLKNLPEGFINEIEYIEPETSLMHLLLEVWSKSCSLKSPYLDCNHLVTSTEIGKYEVITPLDFLRHLLLLNQDGSSFLKDTPTIEIENGFDTEESLIVNWYDAARLAMERVLESGPYYLVAVVNEETGGLESDLTFTDILPTDSAIVDESISMLLNNEISLYSYLSNINSSSARKLSIDPILLHPHFTLYDLIEKLTRLGIHHLWRVTPTAIQKPLGAVGVIDILRYLNYMFQPFHTTHNEPK